MTVKKIDKRRSRGEATRQQIFEGTIKVIAKTGMSAVTHRAVAAAAGVSLSLTTYHFKDLSELVCQATEYFTERFRPKHERMLAKLQDLLDAHDQEALLAPSLRDSIATTISSSVSQYLWHQILHYPEGVMMEMNILFGIHKYPSMQDITQQHQAYLLDTISPFFIALQSKQPVNDARLFLSAVQSLEFEAVANVNNSSQKHIEQQLYRQLSALLNLS